MQKIPKLLPCPFCGANPKVSAFWRVYCPKDFCLTGIEMTYERWNTRKEANDQLLSLVKSIANRKIYSLAVSVEDAELCRKTLELIGEPCKR